MTVSHQAVTAPRVSSGLKLEPYRPRIGALVSGIDLAQPLDDVTRMRLQKAFLQYGVLFFRDQAFGPQRLVEVARLFGEPYKQNRYSHELDGFPDIEVLEKSSKRQQKADVWHADVTWQPNPPKATIGADPAGARLHRQEGRDEHARRPQPVHARRVPVSERPDEGRGAAGDAGGHPARQRRAGAAPGSSRRGRARQHLPRQGARARRHPPSSRTTSCSAPSPRPAMCYGASSSPASRTPRAASSRRRPAR